MAGTTLSRQILEIGAGCRNSARPDLPGGRGATRVPTGIHGMDRTHLSAFLDQRVRDGVIRRAMGKWMKRRSHGIGGR